MGLISVTSLCPPRFPYEKPTGLMPCQHQKLHFYRMHPGRERLPYGCDRPSGWCASWPEGSWIAAERWQVLAGTAAEWPAPELRSCFSPDAEDSRVIADPTKPTQNQLRTLCPSPLLFSRPPGLGYAMWTAKNKMKSFRYYNPPTIQESRNQVQAYDSWKHCSFCQHSS